MDLSLSESMLFLMEGIWMEESSRHRVHIADTIFIRNDLPVKWLFTSKDGFVLRKGKQQLQAIESIPWTLRHTLQRKYRSTVDARTKIARIWTLQQDSIREELLDEAQLSAKLKSPSKLEHMFMIQLYLEGKPYQGCGIFQHHFVISSTEDVDKGSWELKVPPPLKSEAESELIQPHSSKLPVPKEIDAAFWNISKKVVDWLEAYSGFTVERALFSFTLTSSAVFVLTSLESVRLSNLTRKRTQKIMVAPGTRSTLFTLNTSQNTQSRITRSRPSSAVPSSRSKASPTKRYAQLTESRRLKSDSLAALEVLGPVDSRKRRPHSAPMRRQAPQPALDGQEGIASQRKVGEAAFGFFRQTACEGDLCGTLMHLKDPFGEGDEFFVQAHPSFKVVMKSILLCRAETAFTGRTIGYDASRVRETSESMTSKEVRVMH